MSEWKEIQQAVVVQLPRYGVTPDVWATAIDLCDVEQYLFSIAPFSSGDVISARAPGGLVDMTGQSAADASRVFRDGGTLLLRGLHQRIPKVAQLAGDVGRALGLTVRANAYVTPPRAAGLARHFDYHDVLMLQVYGGKNWKAFERISPIPIETTSMSSLERGIAIAAGTGAGSPVLDSAQVIDVKLTDGHFLFLPRGVPHEGETSDGASIHLTLALSAPTSAEVAALGVLAAGLRANSGRAYHRTGELPFEYPLHRRSAEELAAIIEIDRQRSRLPLPGGYLRSLCLIDAIAEATLLEWRPNQEPWLADLGDRKLFIFADQSVEVTVPLSPALNFVARNPRFSINDIPLGTAEERLSIARTLLNAGLLRILDKL